MVKIINSANNEVGASNPGVTNTFTVQNPDNTNAASHAQSLLTVGGTLAGNPWQQWTVGTSRSYSQGITNTTGEESLRINTAASASVSPITGTNLWNMHPSGARTMPLQPCFSASAFSSQTNVTGDNTLYTVQYTTVNFDQASNYSTPNFTAPIAGRYLFCANVTVLGLGPANTVGFAKFNFPSTPATYVFAGGNVGAMRDLTSNGYEFTGSVMVFMNAGDTCNVQVQIANGTKSVSISSLPQSNWFNGVLLT